MTLTNDEDYPIFLDTGLGIVPPTNTSVSNGRLMKLYYCAQFYIGNFFFPGMSINV